MLRPLTSLRAASLAALFSAALIAGLTTGLAAQAGSVTNYGAGCRGTGYSLDGLVTGLPLSGQTGASTRYAIRGWVNSGLPNVICGVGLRCRSRGGTVNLPVSIYSSSRANIPLAELRRATLVVGPTERFYEATFVDPLVLTGPLEYFVVFDNRAGGGIILPIDKTGSSNRTHFEGTTTWSGPFKTQLWNFGILKCELDDCFSQNWPPGLLSQTSNSAGFFALPVNTGPFPRTICGVHFYMSTWKSSGNVPVSIYSDARGVPGSLMRTANMQVNTPKEEGRVVRFEPLKLAANTRFHIVITHPTANGFLLPHSPSGTKVPHYFRSPTATSWSGPFTTVAWNYQVVCCPDCPSANWPAGASGNVTGSPVSYAIRANTGHTEKWIRGLEFRARTRSGQTLLVNVSIHKADSSGDPGALLHTTRTTVAGTLQNRLAVITPPLYLPANRDFYVVIDNRADLYLPVDSTGTKQTHYHGNPRQWNGPFTTLPWNYNALCLHTGQTPRIGALAPRINTTWKLTLYEARPDANAWWCIGAIQQDIDLGFMGARPCRLLNNALFLIPLPVRTDHFGLIQLSIPIPNKSALIGATSYHQFGIADPVNAAGLVTSNACRAVIGQ